MKPTKTRIRTIKSKNHSSSSSASNNNDDHHTQDPVEVFCRIKPISDSAPCITVQSLTELSILSPVSSKTQKIIRCKFNYIFNEKSSQNELFDFAAKPLLKRFVQGENGLLLTYGVTGSGKTYSMCGDSSNPGIVPRCVYTLFSSIGCYQTPKFLIKSDKLNGFEQQDTSDVIKDQEKEARLKRNGRKKITNTNTTTTNSNSWENVSILNGTILDDINKNLTYTIFVNYVEIYNNNTYDLLDDTSGVKSLQAKILREDSNNNIYVNGVVEIEVKTAEEALALYSMGNKRKRMGQTTLNTESSRSHSVFTIRLVTGNKTSVREKKSLIVSQLSLVDLAGSERCNRTNCTGQRLKEAGTINNSLMALRNCLEILRENQKTGNTRLVPYRESRLTLLFKNYFEGEGNVKMIICVNPSAKDYDETVHVMKFAEMSQEVMVLRPIIKITELDDTHSQKNITSTVFAVKDIEIEITQPEMISKQIEVKQPLPKVRILDPEVNEIQSLISYLKRRREMSSHFKTIRDMGDQLRFRLVDLEAEKNSYERQCKYLLPAEREKVKDLKDKLINMNCQYDQIKEKCQVQDKVIDELKINIKEKEFKLQQSILERLYKKGMTHELRRQYLKNQTKRKFNRVESKDDTSIMSNLNKIKRSDTDLDKTSTIDENISQKEVLSTVSLANARKRRSLSFDDSLLEFQTKTIL